MQLRNIQKVEEGTYSVSSLPCPKCEGTLTVNIDSSALFQYNNGADITVVLHNLSADDRERFITGYCPPCWNNLFPDLEEEDDE